MPTWQNVVSREFEDVDLGDERLEKRCQQLAAQLSSQPDKSLPHACGNWANTKAAYRFFSNERVSREKILKPHVAQTVFRSNQAKAILVIQDVTFFNMGARQPLSGLGPIGELEKSCGFLANTAIAVSADKGQVLGILHQEVWTRGIKRPWNERTSEVRRRPRESERWVRGIDEVSRLGIKTDVIHVFDREGDVYEAIELLDGTKQRFVIRASCNRRLSASQGYLLDEIRAHPELGRVIIDVPNRQQPKGVEFIIRAATLRIRPPLEFRGKGREIDIGIIQLLESNPPINGEALEWLLLTSEPHQSVADCIEVADLYSKRWKIEEFHMGLKTGCRLEERQLRSRESLERFLGMADVIAVLLLRLRDLARQSSSALAETELNSIQRMLLAAKYPKLGNKPTIQQALRAIAQLGGFLARKSDGEPGWRTLWKGMQELLVMESGFILASNMTK